MKRLSWLLVVPLALVSASSMQAGCREFDTFTVADGGAAGGSGGAAGMGATSSSSSGSGGSMGTPCKMDVDCAVTETECHKNGTCVNDFCVSNDPPEGTLLKAQSYGDCLDIVCDGNGGVNTMKQNLAEKYNWGNSCYADTCGTAPAPNIGSGCETPWKKQGKCGFNYNCEECVLDADCAAGGNVCVGSKCVPPTCKDAMVNGSETDLNCGGPCVACATGMKCLLPSDCQGGGLCVGNPQTCKAPACDDGVTNGDETGFDCGGSCVMDPNGPKTCATGLTCLLPADCTSGRCEGGQCK